MAVLIVSPDTSILIDYYRSKNKEQTPYQKLLRQGYSYAVSALTMCEFVVGLKDTDYWYEEFDKMLVLPIDENVVLKAHDIYHRLKRENKLIPIPDILIAAAALHNDLPLATLNTEHFKRIDGLQIVPIP
jgi:predicted nucleic acid-binding protein